VPRTDVANVRIEGSGLAVLGVTPGTGHDRNLDAKIGANQNVNAFHIGSRGSMEKSMRLSIVVIAAFALAVVCGSAARCQGGLGFSSLTFTKQERRPGGNDFTVTVGGAGTQNWIAKLSQRPHGQHEHTMWASSQSCPAMMTAFAKLQLIEPFKIVPPGVRGGASEVLLDGDGYEIHAMGCWPRGDRNGEIVLSSNSGPVMDWVEDALKTLAPCWRDQQPDR